RGGGGLALPQRGQSLLLCRPSRHFRAPIRRLRPDRRRARGHGGRQSPLLADFRTAALSVQPRAKPRRLRRRSRARPAGSERALAGVAAGTGGVATTSSCLGIAVRRTASLPLAYARASTSFLLDAAKTWMAGTRPAMTKS